VRLDGMQIILIFSSVALQRNSTLCRHSDGKIQSASLITTLQLNLQIVLAVRGEANRASIDPNVAVLNCLDPGRSSLRAHRDQRIVDRLVVIANDHHDDLVLPWSRRPRTRLHGHVVRSPLARANRAGVLFSAAARQGNCDQHNETRQPS